MFGSLLGVAAKTAYDAYNRNKSSPTNTRQDGSIYKAITGAGQQFNNAYRDIQYNQLNNQLQQLLNQPTPSFDMPELDYQPPPTLSWQEAQARAGQQLNPLWDDTLNKTLEAVDKSSIQRGFFGQLPGAALRRSTAADIESKKNQSIAGMANQLQGQSEASARAQEQLALQKYQTQAQNALQRWQGQQGASQSRLGSIMAMLQMMNQNRQSDRSFGLQEAGLTGTYNGDPTMANRQWQSTAEAQPWYLDLFRRQQEANIANTQRSANAPYGGGGGGGGGSTGGPTPTQTRNTTRDAYGDIDAMIAEQVPLTQILGYIDRMGETLSMYGVSPEELKSWAKRRATGNTAYSDNWQYYTP